MTKLCLYNSQNTLKKRLLHFMKYYMTETNLGSAGKSQKVPKKRPILWVLDAHSTGNECP